MARKVYRLPPCPEYDVEKLESWLQDMAKEDLVLEPESEVFGFFGFTPGQPRSLRYRLQPKPQGVSGDIVPAQEARELAAQFGWEFVDSYRYFYIYRTADPTAREMDTDYEVQAAALKVVKRGFASSLLSEIFTILAICILQAQAGPIRFLVSMPFMFTLALILVPLDFLVSLLFQVLHVHRLQKQLNQHIPLDHNKPWRPGVRANRLRRGILWIMAGLILTVAVMSIGYLLSDRAQPLELYPGNPPFLTLQDMSDSYEPEEWLDYYNRYETLTTPLAQVIDWREDATIQLDGQTYSGAILIVNYFDTASPWLAEQLTRELAKAAKQERHYRELEVPELDVDECLAYTNIYPTILIRQGTVVIEASVNIHSEETGSRFLDWVWLQAETMTG